MTCFRSIFSVRQHRISIPAVDCIYILRLTVSTWVAAALKSKKLKFSEVAKFNNLILPRVYKNLGTFSFESDDPISRTRDRENGSSFQRICALAFLGMLQQSRYMTLLYWRLFGLWSGLMIVKDKRFEEFKSAY